MWTWREENSAIKFDDGAAHGFQVFGYAKPPQVQISGDEAAVLDTDGRWSVYDLTTGVLKEHRF